mmetsp:Transcript_4545/g.10567  ORF Transcript_4545/g.10567 Transcript_4545/m.10567 type:complete len:202 (+) Transcript_4545:108-713(+)
MNSCTYNIGIGSPSTRPAPHPHCCSVHPSIHPRQRVRPHVAGMPHSETEMGDGPALASITPTHTALHGMRYTTVRRSASRCPHPHSAAAEKQSFHLSVRIDWLLRSLFLLREMSWAWGNSPLAQTVNQPATPPHPHQHPSHRRHAQRRKRRHVTSRHVTGRYVWFLLVRRKIGETCSPVAPSSYVQAAAKPSVRRGREKIM